MLKAVKDMILILDPKVAAGGETYDRLMSHLSRLPNIELRVHQEQGAEKALTEVYLIGNTAALSVEDMRALQEHGQVCTRMGAYKPRTSPYSFQGHGKSCLPYVFELAGKYGIKVIAMEVTHESHIDEIRAALEETQ